MKENTGVAHNNVKIFCYTTQFTSLQFCVPHKKSHGVRGLINHYYILLDPQLGHGICAIQQILCSRDECTSMLDKPWIPGFLPQKQPGYQPVHD